MTREEIIGDARLILGDCREVLPTLPRVDACVTDPPYGIAHKAHSNTARNGWRGQKEEAYRQPRLFEEPRPKPVQAAMEFDQ